MTHLKRPTITLGVSPIDSALRLSAATQVGKLHGSPPTQFVARNLATSRRRYVRREKPAKLSAKRSRKLFWGDVFFLLAHVRKIP
jgi:hypothetical protein